MYRCKGMSKDSQKDARSAYFKLQFSRVMIALINVLHVFLCPKMLLDQVIFITVKARSNTEEHNDWHIALKYWLARQSSVLECSCTDAKENPRIHRKTPKSAYLQLRIEVSTLCLVAEENKSICWHLSLDTLDIDLQAMCWGMSINPFSFIHIVFND